MNTIIIGGAMRSGTTLLNNIICNAENTNPQIPECHYLTKLLECYIFGKNSFDTFQNAYFKNINEFKKFNANNIENFFNITRKKYNNCQNLVLKNPEITPLIPEMFELFGNKIKFLVSIRDPRDTVISMMKVGSKLKNNQINSHGLVRAERNMDALSKLYNAYYINLFNRITPELSKNILFIRYEDIVNIPEKTCDEISDFLGLKIKYEPSSSWNNNEIDFDLAKKNSFTSCFVTDLYGSAISTKSIKKYKKQLSSEESDIVAKNCQPIIKMFQY